MSDRIRPRENTGTDSPLESYESFNKAAEESLALSRAFWDEMIPQIPALQERRDKVESRSLVRRHLLKGDYTGKPLNKIELITHTNDSAGYDRDAGTIYANRTAIATELGNNFTDRTSQRLKILATVFHEFCHAVQHYLGTLNKQSYVAHIVLEDFQEDFNDFMLGVFAQWLIEKGTIPEHAVAILSDLQLLIGTDVVRADSGQYKGLDHTAGRSPQGHEISDVRSRLFDAGRRLAQESGAVGATEHCFKTYKDKRNVLGV